MKKPWVKFFAGDFLNGVADLNAEQRGAYMTVLCLIWDRGGPIPDDPQWLARRVGIGVRKWKNLRDQLLEMGKIQTDGETITNRRAMRDLAERGEISEKRAEAAGARWEREKDLFSQENKGDADANASRAANGANSGSTGREWAEKQAKLRSLSGDGASRILGQEMAENSHSRDASASRLHAIPSRARADQSPESRESTTPNELPTRAHARESSADGGADLYALTMACCDAAGLSARIASRPALLAQSMDMVKGWRSAGIDIEATAVPTIAAQFERMEEPAHSLAKFSAAIDTQHRRRQLNAQRNGGKPPIPDGAPILEFADEEGPIAQFRTALAKALRSREYARLCNRVRFEAKDWRAEGDHALLIVTPRARKAWSATDPAADLMSHHGEQVKALASLHVGTQHAVAREAPCDRQSEQPQ